MNADEFYAYLVGIVKPGTPDALSWTSESDGSVDVIKLPWWKLCHKHSKMPGYVFLGQAFAHKGNQQKIWRELHKKSDLFDWQQMKVPSKEPSEYTLYFVVRFGWYWVGLRGKIVET